LDGAARADYVLRLGERSKPNKSKIRPRLKRFDACGCDRGRRTLIGFIPKSEALK